MKVRITPEIVAGKMSSVTLAASLCIALTANSATAGSIERISVDSGSIQIVSTGNLPKASDNGRYVAFHAYGASTPNQINTYLRDRATGLTELVSVANDGSAGGYGGGTDVSNDGRYVVFRGKQLDGSTGYIDVYVRDRATGTTELISVNSDGSLGTVNKIANQVSISGDGRYVVFITDSADIVSADTNGVEDVFVRDRVTGITQRISVASDGTQANGKSGGNYRGTDISTNGRYIVFSSSANNLIPTDTNDKLDLFIHDQVSGTTKRINLANDGSQISNGHYGWFDLSSDGRYVAFGSGGNLFIRDLAADTTELPNLANDGSQANAPISFPNISANGRYVSFLSTANNLVASGNPQSIATFVHDRIANTTEMVDMPHDGSVANFFSFGSSAVSEDGRYVVFASAASNLVAGDSDVNNNWDIFIHDRISGQICQ